eukprot:GILJ01014465.1.p2 GENE.GILJ01014465.1~~GILJ01014465.1.p2  ORF type:complete len:481 (+),score=66.48 GILJ01014465.1:1867-3309(+)
MMESKMNVQLYGCRNIVVLKTYNDLSARLAANLSGAGSDSSQSSTPNQVLQGMARPVRESSRIEAAVAGAVHSDRVDSDSESLSFSLVARHGKAPPLQNGHDLEVTGDIDLLLLEEMAAMRSAKLIPGAQRLLEVHKAGELSLEPPTSLESTGEPTGDPTTSSSTILKRKAESSHESDQLKSINHRQRKRYRSGVEYLSERGLSLTSPLFTAEEHTLARLFQSEMPSADSGAMESVWNRIAAAKDHILPVREKTAKQIQDHIDRFCDPGKRQVRIRYGITKPQLPLPPVATVNSSSSNGHLSTVLSGQLQQRSPTTAQVQTGTQALNQTASSTSSTSVVFNQMNVFNGPMWLPGSLSGPWMVPSIPSMFADPRLPMQPFFGVPVAPVFATNVVPTPSPVTPMRAVQPRFSLPYYGSVHAAAPLASVPHPGVNNSTPLFLVDGDVQSGRQKRRCTHCNEYIAGGHGNRKGCPYKRNIEKKI